MSEYIFNINTLPKRSNFWNTDAPISERVCDYQIKLCKWGNEYPSKPDWLNMLEQLDKEERSKLVSGFCENMNAFHIAASIMSPEIAEHVCDVDLFYQEGLYAKGEGGNTPLHIAFSVGIERTIEIFLALSKNKKTMLSEKNNNGLTPLDMGVLFKHTYLVAKFAT